MSEARRGLCALVVIVLAAVPLAGYVASENSPISTYEGKGIVGGLIAQLKREDDEADAAEEQEAAARELEMSKQERQEAHEATEAAQVEEAEAEQHFLEGEQT
jgi:hypothetical protein